MVNVFEQGDIIFMDFDPQAGHEQRGRRPAIVISNDVYNRFSRLQLVCPITNTNKHHPFHVELPSTIKTTGVVLCDQVRMLDVNSRNAEFFEKAPTEIVSECVDMIFGFIEMK